MIIKNLKIYNFGIYHGEHIFEFTPNNKKNIIIIRGKNGCGKTTIFEAIKLGIYGSLIYGIRTPSKKYFEYIKKRINMQSINEGINESSISLNIQIIWDGKPFDCEIKRLWKIKKNNMIEEKVIIKKNDRVLNPKESDKLLEYIRLWIPIELVEFFFFDGEKLDLLINSTINNILNTKIYSILNLDLYNHLYNDLKNYYDNNHLIESIANEKKKLYKLQCNADLINKMIDENNKIMDLIDEKLKNLKLEINHLNAELYKNGYLSEKQKHNIEKNIKNLEQKLRKEEDSLKKFCGESLPFLILSDKIYKLNDFLEYQDYIRGYESFKRINQNGLKLELLKKYGDENLVNSIILDIEKYYKNTLIGDIPEYYNDLLSGREMATIQKILNDVSKFDGNTINEMFLDINRIKNEIKNYKNMLKNSKNQIIVQLLKEIAEKESEYKKLELELNVAKDKYDKLSAELNKIENEIYKVEHNLDEILSKSTNKASLVKKLMNITEKFIAVKKREKLNELKRNFEEIFYELIRKKDFIYDIEIDNDNLIIKLYDKNGEYIPVSMLSEGEKQIYALSLVYALLKTSNKSIPVVLDSIFGRLDSEHKLNILSKYLPNLGKQVIVLSTDIEISDNDLENINKHIIKIYDLTNKW
jgi:DNA sulfur modification protein DndD